MSTAKTDQSGRILIVVFAGRTCHFVGFVMMRLICVCGQRLRLSTVSPDPSRFAYFTNTLSRGLAHIYFKNVTSYEKLLVQSNLSSKYVWLLALSNTFTLVVFVR